MKTSNTDIFKCLCLDLGMPLRDSNKVPDAAALSGLRKELLQCAELSRDDHCEDRWNALTKDFLYWFNPVRDMNIESVSGFRDAYQLTSFPLKIRKLHTHEQEQNYVATFLKNEDRTRSWRVDRSNPVTRIARQLVRRLMAHCPMDLASLHGLGRHGPGAVYGHEVGTDKNFFSDPPHDLALSYGHEFFFSNPSFLAEYAMTSTIDRAPRHVISRLALVPKDFRGPRGVFTSPKEAMFCQLAQDAALKSLTKTTWWGLCYDPNNQSPSQEVAFLGSANRSWATLDLSDASDLVPLSLVAYLFNRQDYLALARTRPSYVELPNKEGLHRMAMFSPMGDGKTFAVLTLIVSVLTIASMLDRDGFDADELIPMDAIRERAKLARFFGDDIAVEDSYFVAVCEGLEIHNLKVNKQKSFHRGNFREACGMDAYRGYDVTPLRQKPDFDLTFGYHKAVEFHNRMVRFYPHLSRTIGLVRSLIESAYPKAGYTSNSVRHPNCILVPKEEMNHLLFGPRYGARRCCPLRFNPDTQVPELLTYAPIIEQNSISSLNPWWDLNYWLLTKHSSGLDTGNCVETEWISDDHIDCRGSRIATKQYEAMLRKATNRRVCVRRVGLPLAWVTIE